MSWPNIFLNLLTLSRIPLALGVFYFLIYEFFVWALALFLLAVFTDWLDGSVARRFNLSTARGENILEPLTDSLLVFISLLGLVYIKFLTLDFFIVYCLIGLFSQIAKVIFRKYQRKIYLFQVLYLLVSQLYIAISIATQVSQVWTVIVIAMYLLGWYFKKGRVKFFASCLSDKKLKDT